MTSIFRIEWLTPCPLQVRYLNHIHDSVSLELVDREGVQATIGPNLAAKLRKLLCSSLGARMGREAKEYTDPIQRGLDALWRSGRMIEDSGVWRLSWHLGK